MLQTVKDYISNLPDSDFGTFYQRFVLSVEDDMLTAESKSIDVNTINVNNVSCIINELVEELKAQ